MCWEDVLLFLGQFFRATIFCVGFFEFTDAFLESILPIYAFLLYVCISLKSQTVLLGTKVS